MIKEEYVSLETAELLKAKGFKEACHCYYLDGYKFTHYHGEIIPKDKETYPAPTQQVAMRWLRERQKIAYNILIIADGDLGMLHYLFEIQEIDNDFCQSNGSLETTEEQFETYEEACEAAIKYCLNNLIN